MGPRAGTSGVLSKEKSVESCFVVADELEMLSCEFVTVV